MGNLLRKESQMANLKKHFFFCLVFVASLLQSTLSFSQTSEVIEGAKKEGRVVWYTTMNLTTAKKLINRFKENYPFIKPEIMRAGGG